MDFQGIVYHRKLLEKHGNFTKPLQELLQGLSLCEHLFVMELEEFVQKWDSMEIAKENILVIVDCEETIKQVRSWHCPMLGYEPPVQSAGKKRRIQTYLPMIVEGFEEVDFDFLEKVYQRFHGLPWKILETERCILREMTLEDVDDLFHLYEPEEITRYMPGLHKTKEEEKEYMKSYIHYMYGFFGYGLWMVVEKDTGKIIGRAGIEHREEENTQWLELGYVIDVSYQKQGYATEVCQGILQYARENLKEEKIYCFIEKENQSSIHLAKKLGFHWEAYVFLDGRRMNRYLCML